MTDADSRVRDGWKRAYALCGDMRRGANEDHDAQMDVCVER
jgi:hypothetical protein